MCEFEEYVKKFDEKELNTHLQCYALTRGGCNIQTGTIWNDLSGLKFYHEFLFEKKQNWIYINRQTKRAMIKVWRRDEKGAAYLQAETMAEFLVWFKSQTKNIPYLNTLANLFIIACIYCLRINDACNKNWEDFYPCKFHDKTSIRFDLWKSKTFEKKKKWDRPRSLIIGQIDTPLCRVIKS